ncbi:Protein kinase domain protein [Aspergillus sclerotialis]|uniref:Protein kinase domain protein n=1 Tax=Aspergillus sclerotialis TaxID=2070753 RepID=A0A3A2ZKI6_9EURO|nr:Protein kinase domain protein [Aspergillus sclerotialis]
MHPRWEAQVREIVKQLHAVGIVWGDVNPGNIVVDSELNIWVVDFGGGFIDGFVDSSLAGKEEGDLEGIRGIFHLWIRSNDT